jgi:hypothetical protein
MNKKKSRTHYKESPTLKIAKQIEAIYDSKDESKWDKWESLTYLHEVIEGYLNRLQKEDT